MKFQSRLLPSYIVTLALVLGAAGVTTFFIPGVAESPLGWVAMFLMAFIFPYPLTLFTIYALGPLLGVRWPSESSPATVASVVLGTLLLIGTAAVGVGWFTYWLNNRFGARVGYVLLIVLAIAGPISFWLGNVAADCLNLTIARQYCAWRPWWSIW